VTWRLLADVSPAEQLAFANRESTFALTGQLINDSKTNFTQRIEVAGRYYYVKRYLKAGKYLRRFLGASRVAREWRNAGWFVRHGIPTPRCVAMGEGNRWFGDYWGVIVSEEVTQTIDLRMVCRDKPEMLEDRGWRRSMLFSLAEVVAAMHAKRFIHNDLQWRNVLVGFDVRPRIYMIDCPAGRPIYLLGNRRGVVRDLALLDKMGAQVLSRTDRLRFYVKYRNIDRLRGRDKKEVSRIVGFLSKKRPGG
jgi:tRNA A-37 threonylcarbamoyl transferase component Bud32